MRVKPQGRPESQRRSAKYEGSSLCVLLLCALVACALSLVTSRHQARRVFVELEREQARARQYDVEYGQLSLEQSTWGMPARVEKIARESLRMQLPASSRVEIVEAPAAAKPNGPAPANVDSVALAPAITGALR
jgi:cell division protein FtsL